MYLTTVGRTYDEYVELTTPRRKSWARCDRFTEISKDRLQMYMCKLNEREMAAIDEQIAIVLGMNGRDESDAVKRLKSERIGLEVELNTYKKMYERVLDMLVAERIEKDTAAVNKTIEIAEVKVEPKVVEEEVWFEEEPRKKAGGGKAGGGKANINTDSWQEIVRKTGLGSETAKQIVQYRKKYNGYSCVDDLQILPRWGAGCHRKYAKMMEV